MILKLNSQIKSKYIKRIIVPISFSFSIRYIVRTGLLDELRKIAEPIIVITWNQEDLINELQQRGFEVHLLPETKRDETYTNHRRKIDYWFNNFQLQSPSQKIQARFLQQYKSSKSNLIGTIREWFNVLKMYLPGSVAKLFTTEKELLLTHTNYTQIQEWIQPLQAIAVFTVTPFHAQEDILLRVCKDAGMKMLTAILSFDNITKRGWIPVEYDAYMVWNKYNVNELHRIYPFTKNKSVTVTGAAQFDFYKKPEYLIPENEWRQLVGLQNSEGRKIILYAGGPQVLFPNEPQYLQHIDEAITNGTIEGNPIVLFRCHPVDVVQRWKDAIGNSLNIVFDSSWTGIKNLLNANISVDDIKKLCSSLAYTDVHINLCSTMTIDGSAFYKPQIGPAYDEVVPKKAHLLKKMYCQEHFLPVLKTNGLALANSRAALIGFINEALHHPAKMTKASQRIVEEVITYSDGACMPRVIAAIAKQLQ
jgi:hypothetical protein